MNAGLTIRASVLIMLLFYPCCRSAAQEPMQSRIVRLAELEIEHSQIENYKTALKEEISASLRLEPGVLALYAVALKDHPTHVRIFETYADVAAYKKHLESPHFKIYKAATQGMVKSLTLLDTDPIMLGARGM